MMDYDGLIWLSNLDHFSESHGSHGDLVPHDLRNPPILQGGAPKS